MEEIGEIKIDFLWLHDQGGRTNLKTAIIKKDSETCFLIKKKVPDRVFFN